MDLARVSSKGQITIPIEVRKKLNLKEGDKVLFIEEEGKIIIANSSYMALKEIQESMKGEAEKAAIYTEDDVNKLIEDIRGELQKASLEHTVVLSSYGIDEIHAVFQRKFKDKYLLLEKFLSKFSFELVYTPQSTEIGNFPEIRDKKDQPILISAVLGDVDLLLTGDKDFFAIEIDKPEIITAKDFLEQY